jgi:hypothetical protein
MSQENANNGWTQVVRQTLFSSGRKDAGETKNRGVVTRNPYDPLAEEEGEIEEGEIEEEKLEEKVLEEDVALDASLFEMKINDNYVKTGVSSFPKPAGGSTGKDNNKEDESKQNNGHTSSEKDVNADKLVTGETGVVRNYH